MPSLPESRPAATPPARENPATDYDEVLAESFPASDPPPGPLHAGPPTAPPKR